MGFLSLQHNGLKIKKEQRKFRLNHLSFSSSLCRTFFLCFFLVEWWKGIVLFFFFLTSDSSCLSILLNSTTSSFFTDNTSVLSDSRALREFHSSSSDCFSLFSNSFLFPFAEAVSWSFPLSFSYSFTSMESLEQSCFIDSTKASYTGNASSSSSFSSDYGNSFNELFSLNTSYNTLLVQPDQPCVLQPYWLYYNILYLNSPSIGKGGNISVSVKNVQFLVNDYLSFLSNFVGSTPVTLFNTAENTSSLSPLSSNRSNADVKVNASYGSSNSSPNNRIASSISLLSLNSTPKDVTTVGNESIRDYLPRVRVNHPGNKEKVLLLASSRAFRQFLAPTLLSYDPDDPTSSFSNATLNSSSIPTYLQNHLFYPAESLASQTNSAYMKAESHIVLKVFSLTTWYSFFVPVGSSEQKGPFSSWTSLGQLSLPALSLCTAPSLYTSTLVGKSGENVSTMFTHEYRDQKIVMVVVHCSPVELSFDLTIQIENADENYSEEYVFMIVRFCLAIYYLLLILCVVLTVLRKHGQRYVSCHYVLQMQWLVEEETRKQRNRLQNLESRSSKGRVHNSFSMHRRKRESEEAEGGEEHLHRLHDLLQSSSASLSSVYEASLTRSLISSRTSSSSSSSFRHLPLSSSSNESFRNYKNENYTIEEKKSKNLGRKKEEVFPPMKREEEEKRKQKKAGRGKGGHPQRHSDNTFPHARSDTQQDRHYDHRRQRNECGSSPREDPSHDGGDTPRSHSLLFSSTSSFGEDPLAPFALSSGERRMQNTARPPLHTLIRDSFLSLKSSFAGREQLPIDESVLQRSPELRQYFLFSPLKGIFIFVLSLKVILFLLRAIAYSTSGSHELDSSSLIFLDYIFVGVGKECVIALKLLIAMGWGAAVDNLPFLRFILVCAILVFNFLVIFSSVSCEQVNVFVWSSLPPNISVRCVITPINALLVEFGVLIFCIYQSRQLRCVLGQRAWTNHEYPIFSNQNLIRALPTSSCASSSSSVHSGSSYSPIDGSPHKKQKKSRRDSHDSLLTEKNRRNLRKKGKSRKENRKKRRSEEKDDGDTSTSSTMLFPSSSLEHPNSPPPLDELAFSSFPPSPRSDENHVDPLLPNRGVTPTPSRRKSTSRGREKNASRKSRALAFSSRESFSSADASSTPPKEREEDLLNDDLEASMEFQLHLHDHLYVSPALFYGTKAMDDQKGRMETENIEKVPSMLPQLKATIAKNWRQTLRLPPFPSCVSLSSLQQECRKKTKMENGGRKRDPKEKKSSERQNRSVRRAYRAIFSTATKAYRLALAHHWQFLLQLYNTVMWNFVLLLFWPLIFLVCSFYLYNAENYEMPNLFYEMETVHFMTFVVYFFISSG